MSNQDWLARWAAVFTGGVVFFLISLATLPVQP